MNKGTLTTILQHCISCYHIFTISNAHLFNLDPVFPSMLVHFKSLLKPAKFFSDFLLHPLPHFHLPWISFLVYIHAEELKDSLYSWNRSITEYMFLHCDLQSLVLSIHSKSFAFPET